MEECLQWSNQKSLTDKGACGEYLEWKNESKRGSENRERREEEE